MEKTEIPLFSYRKIQFLLRFCQMQLFGSSIFSRIVQKSIHFHFRFVLFYGSLVLMVGKDEESVVEDRKLDECEGNEVEREE